MNGKAAFVYSPDSAVFRLILLLPALTAGILAVFYGQIPSEIIRGTLLGMCIFFFAAAVLWEAIQRKKLQDFSNDICETADALMEGRSPGNFQPYEDTVLSRVQGKLMQYYEKMQDGQSRSDRDRQTIQELVSDISHQIRTPMANIRMFSGILQQHSLNEEKRAEFLTMMDAQITKLDFLMQSLIKMSRLETGTFTMHMEENSLYDTIARAVSSVFAKAEEKEISLDVSCDSGVTVRHDAKWTAEALGNILDNAVKYTPKGGEVRISVRPWQFYIRIDITDNGPGIAEEHYSDIFQRFYRIPETAGEEGVGLGLCLARSIITGQKGYISVRSGRDSRNADSTAGKPSDAASCGTTFSVYLLR